MTRININTATEKELIGLPKIGPSIARKIIAYRKKNGPFSRKDGIKGVDGISTSIFEIIRGNIYASKVAAKTSSPKKKIVAKPAVKTVKPKPTKRKETTKAKAAKPSPKKKQVVKPTAKTLKPKPKSTRKPAIKKTAPSAPKTKSTAVRKSSKPATNQAPKTSTKKTSNKSATTSTKTASAAKRKSAVAPIKKAVSKRVSKIKKVIATKKANDKKASQRKATPSKSTTSPKRKSITTSTKIALDSFKKKTVNTIKKYAKDFIKEQKTKPSAVKPETLKPVKPKTVKKNPKSKDSKISKKDLKRIAKKFKVAPNALRAIMQVESGSNGFLNNNKAKILFHGHVFYQFLEDAKMEPASLAKKYKKIVHKKANDNNYKGGLGEYKRLKAAMNIHKKAALASCSYGLFQLYGYCYADAGFKSVKAFVKAHNASEKLQVKAFLKALKAQNALKALQKKDWKSFADKISGPGQNEAKYASKLAAAYKKLK